jgi:hypothetical protein
MTDLIALKIVIVVLAVGIATLLMMLISLVPQVSQDALVAVVIVYGCLLVVVAVSMLAKDSAP